MIRRALGPKRAGALISALEARGALTRVAHAPAPRASQQPWLRLIAAEADIAAWRASLAPRMQPEPIQRPARALPRRSRGALLQRLATATPAPPVAPPHAQSREALRQRRAVAIVDALAAQSERALSRLEALRLAGATPAALDLVIAAGLVELSAPPQSHGVRQPITEAPKALTPAQSVAVCTILQALEAATDLRALVDDDVAPDAELPALARPIVLHGVTGSGKTEVYLQALQGALDQGRRGIVLVPEIALTPQTVARFNARFPGRVALLHSALKPQERQREWRRIRAGQADVVIGSRSAIFAPLPDLGLIILDEEHDTSYKQDGRAPTYHARAVAVELARLVGAAVVLGSATPSAETYYRARSDEYALVELRARVSDARLPPVTLIDLRGELHAGHTSILSRELLSRMTATLARGEQALLYLNRRGSATCVLCRDCGYVMRCGNCDVPLTHHARQAALICHYCGWREHPPRICPNCGGPGMRFFGIGTERVEATVRERFPQARVLRWDADTVRGYTDHERFGRALADKAVDILIGTQMIAKGIDVPGVTLVGVIAADVALFLPDYRAAERAFQLLTQVAGRAGRGAIPGDVIMQTFSPEHFVIDAAARHDFHAFYDVESAARQAYGYPPFRRFIKLTYTHKDRHACQVAAIALGDRLTQLIADLGLAATDVVGPAPAFIERLRDHYRWQMILRGPDPRAIIAALAPGELGPGWAIDIDPVSSL
jgi:primosomal protein N' (replication factor Y)